MFVPTHSGGMEIIMPFCKTSNKCPAFSLPYIVREGDTLYKIALSYNSSVEAILAANANLNPYNLSVGRVICVPLPREQYPQCRTTNYYIAREGDTFFSIAKKFNIDVNELIAANVGVEPQNIFDGIILCIPVAPSPVCIKIKSDGSMISVINSGDGKVTNFPSRLESESVLVPKSYILTEKRLQEGAVEGAKELLFSPFEIGIRGESRMNNSSAVFVVTDNESMLNIFNLAPVGTEMEVIS